MNRKISITPTGEVVEEEISGNSMSMVSNPSGSKSPSCPPCSHPVTALPPNGDRVNHPNHYTWLKDLCGVEVIDITRHMDFDLGNAIKYILRQGKKPEEGLSSNAKAIEDLEKAVFYINDKIQMLKKDGIN